MQAGKPKVLYRFPASRPIFDMRRFAHDVRPDGTQIDAKRGGVQWDRSIYYYWWHFLRRSEKFQMACERSGDYGSKPLRSVYADFGDIFAFDDTKRGFQAWWNETNADMGTNRGAYLFGYPVQENVTLVRNAASFNSEGSLLIAIPKGMRKREIQRQLDTILSKEIPRKRGERLQKADVRYRPLHERMHGLDTALKVLEVRSNHPQKALWEIAHLAGVSKEVKLEGDEAKSGSRSHAADKKAYLAQHAHRLITRANKVIAGVERGEFPVTK